MSNKEMISSRQLILLIFTFISVTATLFMPTGVAAIAAQDGWISVLLAGGVGVIMAWVISTLGLKYPELTLIEYSQVILGKWIGKIVGLIVIIFFIHITATMFSEIAITIKENLLHQYSIMMIIIILFLTSSYIAKKGLECIARANIIVLVLCYLAMFTCLIFLIKDMNVKLLTPILGNGVMPIIKGALSPAGWFCEIIAIGFIFPFVNRPKQVRVCSIIGVVWVAVTLSFFTALVIMVYGQKWAGNLVFSTLETVKNINIADYIQRIEAIFLIPWLMANIIKLSFFQYITVFAISKWFGFEDDNFLILPVGLLIISLCLVLFISITELFNFLSKAWRFYFIPVEVVIPILLLTVNFVKNKANIKRRI